MIETYRAVSITMVAMIRLTQIWAWMGDNAEQESQFLLGSHDIIPVKVGAEVAKPYIQVAAMM